MKFNKKQLLICIFLIFIAFAIRWFKINDFLFFGFEQGRDALVTQDIISLKHFPLIGPSTSAPGIFHGAYYYYLMAIPYYLGSGNPLFAVFFIVLISSLTSIIGYFFAKDVFNSYKWGIIYGLLIAFSFEYILYSRWLIHVPFSVPLTLASYFMLWKYSKLQKGEFLIAFFILASFACQFEMILLPQFIFSFIVFYLFRIVRIARIKNIFIGLFVSLIIFSPQIIFDFRNQHIISNSLVTFVSNIDKNTDIIDSAKMLIIQTNGQFKRSLIYTENIYLKIIYLFLLIYGLWFFLKNKENHKIFCFILIWSLMSLSLILIGSGNPHNYLGIGLAWIFLLCCSLKGYLNKKFYVGLILLSILIIYSWAASFQDLSRNKNIFFTTIQDDLNYADQKKVLKYIHQDANGESYKLIAFTIPYLHPEGWEYLHNYFYPQDSNKKDAKIVYIIIEKHVAPEWSNVWIVDLGKTTLISEKSFGLINVQKRLFIE